MCNECILRAWDWAALRRICEREARRILRSHGDVEDVVQLALERAWRHRDRCLQPDAPEGWVVRIAQREALREHRRRRDAPVLEEAPEATVEARDDVVLQGLVVRSALGLLSERERELVHLRYGCELTSEEIGDRLGVSPGAVRVRLHRLHRTLAGVIDDA